MKGGIMRRKILIGVLIVVVVGALAMALALMQHTPPSVDVMAGSSLIANAIQDVAGDKLETRTLVPPGVCPGHYDVKPSDIEALANSTALFIHDYQQYFQNVNGAVEAAKNPDLIITVLNVTGNWMMPQVQAEAVDKIAQALADIDPENALYYQQRAAERTQAILAKGEEVANKLEEAGVGGVKVICAEMQQGFVKWAGFDIVATYGRPEELSPADVEQLVTDAKEEGVSLVIDNLQSGATATSESMAQDIGAIQVTISNFPGGFEGTETWEKTIDKNVDLLLEALNQWEEQYG
ncbi:zinc ABC transporter substrate-binding protein [candidate division KSB1 bacterium]|nr:MAG: zinc ABC transporter substrate-binding protein [candidate division KSB1 bacterium]